MSMIEKFLKDKKTLLKNIEGVREAAIKAMNDKTDEMIDNFIGGFEEMVANASDEEFVAFITSGELDEEDIIAATAFRAEAKENHTGVKPVDEDREHHIHVIVLN